MKNEKTDSVKCAPVFVGMNRIPDGFTLVELLVVLAVTGVLAILLLPALAGTNIQGKAGQCINNQRQLITAWLMYSVDNSSRLAVNSDPHVYGSMLFPHTGGGPSWVSGSLDWSTGSYNTNTVYLVNDSYSLLGGYVGRQANVFACPAENFVSPAQRLAGWTRRARSVSMSAAVGDGDKYMEPGNPFAWSAWYVARKATDFHYPPPASVWVLADEHPDSIDDGMLYCPSFLTTTFTELPGAQHDSGGTLAFADGHAEIHKWLGPVMQSHATVSFNVIQQIPTQLNDPDLAYLANHTPQN